LTNSLQLLLVENLIQDIAGEGSVLVYNMSYEKGILKNLAAQYPQYAESLNEIKERIVDDAMDAIEKDNPSLKNVLPKVFARGNLDPTSLGSLIDMIGNIAFGDAKARSADLLGHVFEYFLGEFALAEGKKGGQFYTPRSVVEMLVEMLQP
jgi:type I restriction-modification system DNA methylase subunit